MGHCLFGRVLVVLVACALASSFSSTLAIADILIESHHDHRDADVSMLLASFRDELAQAGVTVRPMDVVADAGNQLPLPGVSDPALGPSYPLELSGQVELGTKQVFRGDYATGLTTLEGVIKGVHDNPALVVADGSSSTWLTKAYAAMAFAHIRSRRADAATAAVIEQIHSFPEDPIGRIVGPEVAALSESLRKTVESAGRGTLRVIVSRPDVQAFINERPRGKGRSFTSTAGGKYRLLLVRFGISRRYTATVVPDQDTDLYVDWDADSAFTVTNDWIGFVWPTETEDKTDLAAAKYARGSRKHDIIVASIVRRRGGRYLVGSTFEKRTGVLLRRRAISFGPGNEACKRALARYQLRGDGHNCLIELPSETPPPETSVPVAKDVYLWPGIVASASVMAALGGLVMAYSHADRPTGPPRHGNLPAVGLIFGGVGLGAAAIWAIPASSGGGGDGMMLRRSRAPIYLAAGTASAAFAAGIYLLHRDDQGTCGLEGPGACRYLYETTALSWTLIGTGVAAVGFGTYWHLSSPRDGRKPSLSLGLTSGGAMASLGGSF